MRQIEKAEKNQRAINKICSGAVEDGLKELALGASKEILLSVLKALPFGGFAAVAIEAIIKVLGRN